MGRTIFVGLLVIAGCTPIDSPAGAGKPKKTESVTTPALPCAVDVILRGKCQLCHGNPTQFTAPMSLTTWDELHAPALEHPETPALVYERMAQRIHDVLRPMPPRDQPQLTASELSTLDIWLGAQAPHGEGCVDEPSTPNTDREPIADSGIRHTAPHDAGPDSNAGSSSPPKNVNPNDASAQAGAGGANDSSGGASGSTTKPTNPDDAATPTMTGVDVGEKPDDSECEYIEIRARQDESGAPFQVPAGASDFYQCFLYDMKFDGPTQALSFETVPDNLNVVHHWLLRTADRIDATGPLITCDATYPTNKLIAGWAPGSSDWYPPKDVGIDLARGIFYIEVHYNNIGKPATTDRSGVRICTTKKLRPKTASVSWLGTQLFSIPAKASNYDVTSRCRPQRQTEDIHILRTWPHMHGLGNHARMVVDRSDRTNQVVIDQPFAFESQKAYDTPLTLKAGDSITTTCTFNNPNDQAVGVGTRSVDEMCHFFVTAYPAYALTNDAPSTETGVCLGFP